MPGKWFFNELWIEIAEYECWLREKLSDIYKAWCYFYATLSWNCLICSCLLNYKILKDGKMKNATVSKIQRFEIKLIILNFLSKAETLFSSNNILRSLIESKSVCKVLSLRKMWKILFARWWKKIIAVSSGVQYCI